MKRRNAAKLLAPASPADTQVVVHWNWISSSAGMPMAESVGIDVAMQVVEAGRHQLAAGVDHAQRAGGRDVGFDSLDRAEADADVAPAAQALARIEHVAALDDEVELVVRPHRGERAAARRHERKRTGSAEEITPRCI
jgi:hypothetical protein